MAVAEVKPARRPAHRPSRRTHIVDAAMKLFARLPLDEVSVADIAAAADMTPAAVYYHFAGKEQILLEGVQAFTGELLDRARKGVDDDEPVRDLTTALFELVRTRRAAASVYFVTSAGLNLAMEAHRKIVRAELSDLFSLAARRTHRRLPAADAGVMGAALVSLLEVSSAAYLGRDPSFRGARPAAVARTVADLADRIVGAE